MALAQILIFENFWNFLKIFFLKEENFVKEDEGFWE